MLSLGVVGVQVLSTQLSTHFSIEISKRVFWKHFVECTVGEEANAFQKLVITVAFIKRIVNDHRNLIIDHLMFNCCFVIFRLTKACEICKKAIGLSFVFNEKVADSFC